MGWNRLDGIIVLSSLIDMISPLFGDGVDLGFMRALRVLRVMRAVRVLKAAPEAMAVMNSMWVSLTSMGGFLLVWLIFMLISRSSARVSTAALASSSSTKTPGDSRSTRS